MYRHRRADRRRYGVRLPWVVNLDLRHHATVLMIQDVTVIHEAAHNLWMRECKPDNHEIPGQHANGVDVAVEELGRPIDIHHLDSDLMNMEDMHVIGVIANGP